VTAAGSRVRRCHKVSPASPVGGQSCLVALVLPDANICRQRAVDADQSLLDLGRRTRTECSCPTADGTGLAAAAPVGVDPGVGRRCTTC
jgi:hypothetical protein